MTKANYSTHLIDVVRPLCGGQAGPVIADDILHGVPAAQFLRARAAVHPGGDLHVRKGLFVCVVGRVLGQCLCDRQIGEGYGAGTNLKDIPY
jgi:hypothetical protein